MHWPRPPISVARTMATWVEAIAASSLSGWASACAGWACEPGGGSRTGVLDGLNARRRVARSSGQRDRGASRRRMAFVLAAGRRRATGLATKRSSGSGGIWTAADDRLRPISNVRLPRSARSLSSCCRVASHDRFGDRALVPRPIRSVATPHGWIVAEGIARSAAGRPEHETDRPAPRSLTRACGRMRERARFG
jgi:hypothetical protein